MWRDYTPTQRNKATKKKQWGRTKFEKEGGGVSNIGGLYKIEENPLPTRMVFTNFHIAKY